MTDPDSEQDAAARPAGRPEYKPSDDVRQQVRALAAEKKTKGEIARAIGVSRNTLRKHFAAELAVLAPAVAAPEQQLDFGGAAHKVATVVAAAAPGRPEFEPTERQRRMVRLWAADDWTEDRMAQQLGLARNTLRKHFGGELQYGADKVRTQVLLDLERASAGGKVAASNRLLDLTGAVAPPAPPKDQVADDEPLGKKAQAKVDALTAERGTPWADLVH